MKRTLSVLSSFSTFTLSTSFIVSCGWKTPPITVPQLVHIFNVLNAQVIDNKNEIPKFHEKLNMPWNFEEENQTIEKARIWSDSMLLTLNSKLAGPDVGYINQSLNIISGSIDDQYLDDSLEISKETLNLMQSYYFTTRINDIYSIDSDKWLSEEEFKGEKILKTPIKINNQEIEVQENNQPQIHEQYYSSIDISKIWALGNQTMKSNEYTVRFLFSFGPSKDFKIDPVVFYIDVDMER